MLDDYSNEVLLLCGGFVGGQAYSETPKYPLFDDRCCMLAIDSRYFIFNKNETSYQDGFVLFLDILLAIMTHIAVLQALLYRLEACAPLVALYIDVRISLENTQNVIHTSTILIPWD